MSQGKRISSHSSLGIYLHKKFTYQKVPIEDTSDIWEGQFIEIGGKHLEKKIIIGNIYRPPENPVDNYRQFTDQITHIFDYLLKINCEAVIAGDMNIDLLKVHERYIYCDYFDNILNHWFYPRITLPTGLSKKKRYPYT